MAILYKCNACSVVSEKPLAELKIDATTVGLGIVKIHLCSKCQPIMAKQYLGKK